jgi:serine/threonine protein kinase
MASIYRLMGDDGLLPLIMKIPHLGAGERAANVISFEVCRTVLGALSQGPHHPTLIAYGDVETTPYLVMEYIEGRTLNEWTRRAPIPTEETTRLGHAFAMALHDIHRQDVVHLDLKSTNVMVRASGEATIIDFGLSSHRHYPDLLAEELRFPVGNWSYMSPEQVLGVRCDPRSDLFALGALLGSRRPGSLRLRRGSGIRSRKSRAGGDHRTRRAPASGRHGEHRAPLAEGEEVRAATLSAALHHDHSVANRDRGGGRHAK